MVGFSLVNHRWFMKFAKLSPHQTLPLYGMITVKYVASYLLEFWSEYIINGDRQWECYYGKIVWPIFNPYIISTGLSTQQLILCVLGSYIRTLCVFFFPFCALIVLSPLLMMMTLLIHFPLTMTMMKNLMYDKINLYTYVHTCVHNCWFKSHTLNLHSYTCIYVCSNIHIYVLYTYVCKYIH